MSLHSDNLIPEFQGRVVGQRLEEDFLWGLLQKDSPLIGSWIGGAVDMVLTDIGDLIPAEQRAMWESFKHPHADITHVHAFLAFCLWQYPGLMDAVLREKHHFKIACSYFVRQVLPKLFEDFFNGAHKGHDVQSFVRDFRAKYMFTVGVSLGETADLLLEG